MDWPGTLFGAAGLISAITALLSVIRNGNRAKSSGETVDATHAMVRQIDSAVNGKPPGDAPMVQQVQDLHDQIPPREPEEAVIPLLKKMSSDIADLKGTKP